MAAGRITAHDQQPARRDLPPGDGLHKRRNKYRTVESGQAKGQHISQGDEEAPKQSSPSCRKTTTVSRTTMQLISSDLTINTDWRYLVRTIFRLSLIEIVEKDVFVSWLVADHTFRPPELGT